MSLAAGAAGASAQHATARGVAPPSQTGLEGALIVLVRHAETAPDGTRNPPLSDAGLARADRLAAFLAEAGLDAVLTSPYARTRATAAPLAARLGVAVEEYDPSALDALARRLEREAGAAGRGADGEFRVLVVGHSNTTPELVRALGGDPGDPIAGDEHDRVYVLALGSGAVRTLVLRY